MSRLQGWEQPNDDDSWTWRNYTRDDPYTGDGSLRDRSATIIPIAAGAFAGCLTGVIATLTADVWAGWIG